METCRFFRKTPFWNPCFVSVYLVMLAGYRRVVTAPGLTGSLLTILEFIGLGFRV